MSEENSETRKLFVSYSWSNPKHEEWVISFAHELSENGVHVIIDKWDLKPGHDAHAFMEKMVTSPEIYKVIIICDKVYADKSNNRSGGAGAEAQIITPEIYNKTTQDKFAAVVREFEEDGSACLPTYYKGRIYFDLSEESGKYADEFERILRWIWGVNLYERPAIGNRPSFLAREKSIRRINTKSRLDRAVTSIRDGRSNASGAISDYLDFIAREFENFRVAQNAENNITFDEVVISNIDEFLPYRNEIIEIFELISRYDPSDTNIRLLHRFFEKLLRYTKRSSSMASYSSVDFDNFRFIIHELFLYCIAIFIANEKFDEASFFFNNDYYFESETGENLHRFDVFKLYTDIFDIRKKRLSINKISLRAEIIHNRCSGSGVEFRYLAEADLICYIQSVSGNSHGYWWPETLIYIDHWGGSFELFSKSKSIKYFDRIKKLIGFASPAEFQKFVLGMASSNNLPRFGYRTIDLVRLTGAEAMGTLP